MFNSGDFKHCSLDTLLCRSFPQCVNSSTRNSNSLDNCYGIINYAYSVRARPPLNISHQCDSSTLCIPACQIKQNFTIMIFEILLYPTAQWRGIKNKKHIIKAESHHKKKSAFKDGNKAGVIEANWIWISSWEQQGCSTRNTEVRN